VHFLITCNSGTGGARRCVLSVLYTSFAAEVCLRYQYRASRSIWAQTRVSAVRYCWPLLYRYLGNRLCWKDCPLQDCAIGRIFQLGRMAVLHSSGLINWMSGQLIGLINMYCKEMQSKGWVQIGIVRLIQQRRISRGAFQRPVQHGTRHTAQGTRYTAHGTRRKINPDKRNT
jgi:hypothetical protein